MSGRIRRERGGDVTISFTPGEPEVIRAAFTDLLELLDSRASAEAPVEIAPGLLDPFAGQGGEVAPEDPALARLLPDAYPDDPEATGEFRRYTEGDLLAHKRAKIVLLVGGMEQAIAHGAVRLDPEAALAWLNALNDLRLTLGTRLEIEDDYEALVDSLEPDDPRLPALALYEWLTAFQEMLVSTQRP